MCSRLKQHVFAETILPGNHLSNGWRWSSSDQRHERHFNLRRPDISQEKARQEEPQHNQRWSRRMMLLFSLLSPFTQRERHLKSKGSFMSWGIIPLRFLKFLNVSLAYIFIHFYFCVCNAGVPLWGAFEPQPEERCFCSTPFTLNRFLTTKRSFLQRSVERPRRDVYVNFPVDFLSHKGLDFSLPMMMKLSQSAYVPQMLELISDKVISPEQLPL